MVSQKYEWTVAQVTFDDKDQTPLDKDYYGNPVSTPLISAHGGEELDDDEVYDWPTIDKGPPRPGLVPQSGDPEHPVRWILPQDGGSAETAGPAYIREQADALSEDERYARNNYTGDALNAEVINTYLRSGEFKAGGWIRVESAVKRIINDLDNAIEAHSLDRNVTVRRGLRLSQDDIDKFQVGKTLVDPAYFSTSMDEEYVERITSSTGDKRGVVLVLDVPAGTNFLPYPPEKEILLGRNTRVRITGVDSSGDKVRIQAEVVSGIDKANVRGGSHLSPPGRPSMTRMLADLIKAMPLEPAMTKVMAQALKDGLDAAHRYGLDGLVDKAGFWTEFEQIMTGPMEAYAERAILLAASRHKQLRVPRKTLEQAAKREASRFTKRWYRYIRNTTANRMWDLKDVVGPDLERGAAHLFSRNRAELIAGNEASRLNDIGNLMVYNLAGVAQEFWHTQQDRKVDDICRGLSGKVFPVGEGPRPVVDTHLFCRCERLPVLSVSKMRTIRKQDDIDCPEGLEPKRDGIEKSAQEAVGPNAGKGGMIFGEDPDPEMAAHDMSSKVENAGPPRPGLVPQSGDPAHPVRWIRPRDPDQGQQSAEGENTLNDHDMETASMGLKREAVTAIGLADRAGFKPPGKVTWTSEGDFGSDGEAGWNPDDDEGTIYINPEVWPDEDPDLGHTATHEYAHVLVQRFLGNGPDTVETGSEKFRRLAEEADWEAITGKTLVGEHDWAGDPREGFAEALSQFMEDPERLQEVAPELYDEVGRIAGVMRGEEEQVAAWTGGGEITEQQARLMSDSELQEAFDATEALYDGILEREEHEGAYDTAQERARLERVSNTLYDELGRRKEGEKMDNHTTASNVNAGHSYERMRTIYRVYEGASSQAEGGRQRPFGHEDGNVEKQGPPGPPPHPGLVWHEETSRWRSEAPGPSGLSATRPQRHLAQLVHMTDAELKTDLAEARESLARSRGHARGVAARGGRYREVAQRELAPYRAKINRVQDEQKRRKAGGQRFDIEKEGDGGGIAGPGDGMVGSDVHTPVGGFARRIRRKTEKARLIRIAKAVKNPTRYDMFVVDKQFTGAPRDKRFIVAGYASPVIVDLEGHRIGHETLAKDLPRFLAMGGRYANVNVMHSNVTIGRILPEFTSADGHVYRTEVDDVGLFVIAEIRTDEAAPAVCAQVIDDVLGGVLKSFSISGNASNPKFICEDDRCFYDIGELQLLEITICEEGVNQDAKFDIIAKALKTGTYFGVKVIKRRVDKGVPAGRPWMDDELLDAAHFYGELVRSGENPRRAYKRAGERYPRVEMSTSLFTANQDFEWFWLDVAQFEGLEIPEWRVGNKTRWTIKAWVEEFTEGLRSLIEE